MVDFPSLCLIPRGHTHLELAMLTQFLVRVKNTDQSQRGFCIAVGLPACLLACMYVRTYVCMHVCMYLWRRVFDSNSDVLPKEAGGERYVFFPGVDLGSEHGKFLKASADRFRNLWRLETEINVFKIQCPHWGVIRPCVRTRWYRKRPAFSLWISAQNASCDMSMCISIGQARTKRVSRDTGPAFSL